MILPQYARPSGVHPPLAYPEYRSTLLRAPSRPLVVLPPTEEPAANAADPVLSTLPADRRDTLVATPRPGRYTFDIRLQGADETVFFDV